MSDDFDAKIKALAEAYVDDIKTEDDYQKDVISFIAGANAAREILQGEIDDQIELVEEVSAQRAQLKLDLARLKTQLDLCVDALKSIETLHTPGDIKDWGPAECFAKCQSIARNSLIKLSDTGDLV